MSTTTESKNPLLSALECEIKSLQQVSGQLQQLSSTLLTPTHKETIEKITRHIKKTTDALKLLAEFYSIESGELVLQNKPFNLLSIIYDACAELKTEIDQKDISVSINIDSDVPSFIKGDGEKIKKIVAVILNTVIEPPSPGDITFCIAIHKKHAKQLELAFTILNADMIGNQEHFSLLSICQKLIEFLGGNVLQSHSLSFTLPFQTSNQAQSAKPPAKIKQEKIRTLCIDQSAACRNFIKYSLSKWGIGCDVINNASDALYLLKKAAHEEQAYTVVFISNHLYGIGGFELIQIIRLVEEIAETPIILLSSCDEVVNDGRLQDLRILQYLTKPLCEEKLYEGVVAALR